MAEVRPEIVEQLKELKSMLPETADLETFLHEAQAKWIEAPADEKEKAQLAWRSAEARKSFTPEAFRHFFWCIWRKEVAPYVLTEWLPSFGQGDWTLLECFRGSTKSTTLTITYGIFSFGHFPETSDLVIQANDLSANRTTAARAMIIKEFSGWRACFPNVVPDEKRGWGANGYFIKDTNICGTNDENYGVWVEKTMRDHVKDPSFVGAGITSGDIVGMHPRRIFIDDVHDRNNSKSAKDRENVVENVKKNVMPILTKPYTDQKPFIGIACTFWDRNDAYHMLLETGLFKHIKTPIMHYVKDGEAFDAEFEGKKVKLTWPEAYPITMVELYRQSNDSATFNLEYMCDEYAASDKSYTWQSFEEIDVNWGWPLYGGADPVYSMQEGGGTSHFAMLYGLLTPYRTMVIADGVLEKCSAGQAEVYMVRAQNSFPTFQQISMEGDTANALFIALVTRNPGLVVVPFKFSEINRIGGQNKFLRQYQWLEPLFRSGAVQVSKKDTPALRAVRKYLDRYPNISETEDLADIGDALVALTYSCPEIWTHIVTNIANPIHNVKRKRQMRPNPYDGIQNYSYLR